MLGLVCLDPQTAFFAFGAARVERATFSSWLSLVPFCHPCHRAAGEHVDHTLASQTCTAAHVIQCGLCHQLTLPGRFVVQRRPSAPRRSAFRGAYRHTGHWLGNESCRCILPLCWSRTVRHVGIYTVQHHIACLCFGCAQRHDCRLAHQRRSCPRHSHPFRYTGHIATLHYRPNSTAIPIKILKPACQLRRFSHVTTSPGPTPRSPTTPATTTPRSKTTSSTTPRFRRVS